MKMDTVLWRRRALHSYAGCLLLLLLGSGWGSGARPPGPLGPSDRPEAYFNGSAYIKISQPFSLKQLVGLSFRSCVGGELFSQRFEGYTLHVTALFSQVVVSWARPGVTPREVALPRATLDNRWHWVALRYRPAPPSLLLQVDKDTQVISNVTWNGELLSMGGLEAGGATLLVGSVFSGCVREGPQLEFHAATAAAHNVRFGPCPLATEPCKDRKDVLLMPPKDHCYNEPCMRHGTCISRHDRYECHCTPRYSGNNCEVDVGAACARDPPPCARGTCIDDDTGDYHCVCPHNYTGRNCSISLAQPAACAQEPCANGGTCVVPQTHDTHEDYVCICPTGFTGRDCETDVDECAGAGARACLNGGRCRDQPGHYVCDCTDTGYTGRHCSENVDECAAVPGVCGHGACYDTYGGFVCACAHPYTGDTCHTMSWCASGPCGLGGACVEEAAGFRCVCARGWAPPLCDKPIAEPALADPNPCDTLLCPLHSHCLYNATSANGTPAKAICVCDTGYYGASGVSPNCSRVEAACEAGVCLNGAACAQAPDHFNCTCAPGYKGAYCETAVGAAAAAAGKALAERCAAQPCAHKAACTDTPSGFRCECEPGWGGARCDVPAAVPCGPRSCENGGSCRDTGVCECRPGYAGVACELPVDCRATGCAANQECVEELGVWWCSAASAACAAAPCHNGTCVPGDTPAHYHCLCPPGTKGRHCETDVDECALMPKVCNQGVCVNVPGSFQCYCKPGYTGDRCEQDIDECLSAPCKNGGACRDLENNFECTCKEGFEGKDCSVNIDECVSSPCAAGATCVDGVATYTCACPPGLSGPRCETDVDDCLSSPCQHEGKCTDLLNGFSCECLGTGYTGPTCDVNVDECASAPCRHDAVCVDGRDDYRCVCHPGYTGKNCETDINECESSPCQFGGTCLQRSNVTLYQQYAQWSNELPAEFAQPFTHANASGFVCICPLGTEGPRCETNVDECASSPCVHGACTDLVGGYTCDCAPGYEGHDCHLEIDECARYSPCVHGRCYDRRASYLCVCDADWGGRNCSVKLTGCMNSPCQHGGSCRPWLAGDEQRYNCSCAPGYYGHNCRRITTMSLEKTSYVEVNTSREEGYDISFRFKTTLGNGLLAMGRGLTYFFLELSAGRLNLHSSLLNKWEGVFIGSNLNDSNWQKVFVTINSSHVVLAANEEQTIYPISQLEAANSSVTSFPVTRLGTPGPAFAPLTHTQDRFVGCFRDVVVNSRWVLPPMSNTSSEGGGAGEGEGEGETSGESSLAAGVVRGVVAGCPRVAQCSPSPCLAGGRCHDAWSTFVCVCPRPQLGDRCQYNYTAATFLHESATSAGAVRVEAGEGWRRALRAALDISMFIRTRKPTGHIFYLGAGKYGQADETMVGASLRAGELLVTLRFNQTPEEYTVGGTRLDNGHLHLIEVVRNSTLVQVKLNGTEYFRKSISAARQLDAQVLYLGGPPPPPTPEGADAPLDESQYFKGVIQDVEISNGVNTSIVELFPLETGEGPAPALPPLFGAAVLPAAGAAPGVLSDDACASRPCLHDAACTTTWNDYVCTCPRGYKGKQCAEVEFCQLQGCPPNSHCTNLDSGYECVSNATFDGASTVLVYELRAPPPPPAQPSRPPTDITITYRSMTGGTLLYAESRASPAYSREWFSVGVFRDQVSLQWRLGGQLPTTRRLRKLTPDYDWTKLRLAVHDDTLRGTFVDAEAAEELVEAGFPVVAWQALLTAGVIQLGAAPKHDNPTTTELMTESTLFTEYSTGDDWPAQNTIGEYFKGCVGAVHVGGRLLPFFTEEELFVGAAAALLAAQPHYALTSGRGWGFSSGVGCVLCLESDCLAGGRCHDLRNHYHCDCVPGRQGTHCEIEVDECVGHRCEHGATCVDRLAHYTCHCAPGYHGQFCELIVDACESSPCLAGGTCTSLPPGVAGGGVGGAAGEAGYSCACPPRRSGARCEVQLQPASCSDTPCAPGHATCLDVPDAATGNNWTCVCLPGYVGSTCAAAFCEDTPCVHGTCNTTAKEPFCECSVGWGGRLCGRERDVCAEGYCLHGARCRPRPHPVCDCAGTGYTGVRCETDIDECAAGLVSCGPGTCVNHDGYFTCNCSSGFCGVECAVLDPCAANNGSGPCQHAAACQQRCTTVPLYHCLCVDGWGGVNCTEQLTSSGLGGASSGLVVGVAAAVVALLTAGGTAALLAARARRKRATRGTYSPSGQEYRNPRHDAPPALKPPPEERLI